MDDFERPEAPKLGDERDLPFDAATSTEELFSQFEEETPAVTSQVSVVEPLLKQNMPKKKVVLFVLAIVMAVALVGGVVWFVLASNASQGEPGEDVVGEVSEGGDSEDKKPTNEPASKDEFVTLSVDDELVQKSFDEFSPVTSPWDNQTAFYTKAISGNLDRQTVMDIAFSNVRATNDSMSTECKGSYPFDTDTSEPWMAEYCYSGEELRQEISKLFGFYYAFTENDTLSQVCPYNYNAINDEFYQTTICGGMFPAGVIRELYKAKKDENRIYLYELATYWSQARDDCSEVCRLSDEGWDAEIEGLTVEELNKARKLSKYPGANEVFDKFKWTFVWNGENYVFEKLERL